MLASGSDRTANRAQNYQQYDVSFAPSSRLQPNRKDALRLLPDLSGYAFLRLLTPFPTRRFFLSSLQPHPLSLTLLHFGSSLGFQLSSSRLVLPYSPRFTITILICRRPLTWLCTSSDTPASPSDITPNSFHPQSLVTCSPRTQHPCSRSPRLACCLDKSDRIKHILFRFFYHKIGHACHIRHTQSSTLSRRVRKHVQKLSSCEPHLSFSLRLLFSLHQPHLSPIFSHLLVFLLLPLLSSTFPFDPRHPSALHIQQLGHSSATARPSHIFHLLIIPARVPVRSTRQ